MSDTSHHHDAATACRNCGSELALQAPAPRYCGQCGQETALHPPTLGEFLHEFVGHYIALEGALWRTLTLLITRPGQLTLEYFAGRRRRYVLPLRLYLTCSFLFFLIIKLMPGAPPPPGSHGLLNPKQAIEQEGVVEDDAGDLAECLKPGARCGRLETSIASAAQRWKQDPRASEHFLSRFTSMVPYAVFLMLPVFAAIVMLAYRSRRMRYGEHVVFALHMHAFWFLALLALWLLPDAATFWGVLGVVGYGVWALRTVYDGRWKMTVLRGVFISALYLFLLMVATTGLVAGLFLWG
ncbi:DUF3667 domain-containing protein [Ideonella sp. BN130291]|uniref:DUF3667 domain-containing protein n=1 Tax=Ideonella sp. BN130291 TaxID=3112940 RepID=UPI002E260E42|nr:DUF3667 domain-containing protein [Ideonella sp. BN130291]